MLPTQSFTNFGAYTFIYYEGMMWHNMPNYLWYVDVHEYIYRKSVGWLPNTNIALKYPDFRDILSGKYCQIIGKFDKVSNYINHFQLHCVMSTHL